jgi:hypothetical protein
MMQAEHIIVARNQAGQPTSATTHNLPNNLDEKMIPLTLLYLARGTLAGSVALGLDVVRVEVHSLLPGEEFIQAIERVKRESPQPLLVVTRDDLLA